MATTTITHKDVAKHSKEAKGKKDAKMERETRLVAELFVKTALKAGEMAGCPFDPAKSERERYRRRAAAEARLQESIIKAVHKEAVERGVPDPFDRVYAYGVKQGLERASGKQRHKS